MKKLIPAIVLLLISAIVMSTASYAWFSMNTQVTATGMQVKAKSNSTFLLIGNENITAEKTAAGIQAQTGADLTSEDLTVALADAAKYPSKVWLGDTADGYTTLSLNAVDTKAKAATEGNWYTANSDDPTLWGGSGHVKNAAALTSTNFDNYVIKKSVNLTLAVGSTKANKLTVTPTITIVDDYFKTTDTAVDDNKTYYTESAGTYTAVASPVDADIATYYEKALDYSAVKVLVVSDNNIVVIMDKDTTGAQNLYDASNNADLTDTTVHHVDIYIYYDGTDTTVFTNNAINLAGATIDLEFAVMVNE
ncbi:MAG: hypothetical protein IJU52_04255 [Clostridia bacterium]|nr:hypothetical protein [Clostridia bacterium]